MPDLIDTIQEHQSRESEGLLAKAHQAATEIPEGNPGVCGHCEEFNPRLVNDACARCRDEFNL